MTGWGWVGDGEDATEAGGGGEEEDAEDEVGHGRTRNMMLLRWERRGGRGWG